MDLDRERDLARRLWREGDCDFERRRWDGERDGECRLGLSEGERCSDGDLRLVRDLDLDLLPRLCLSELRCGDWCLSLDLLRPLLSSLPLLLSRLGLRLDPDCEREVNRALRGDRDMLRPLLLPLPLATRCTWSVLWVRPSRPLLLLLLLLLCLCRLLLLCLLRLLLLLLLCVSLLSLLLLRVCGLTERLLPCLLAWGPSSAMFTSCVDCLLSDASLSTEPFEVTYSLLMLPCSVPARACTNDQQMSSATEIISLVYSNKFLTLQA